MENIQEDVLQAKGGWNEPAQAMVVEERSDLVKIYAAVREKCQANIDEAFDRVSRDVGYVVTTGIPVDIVLEEGKVKSVRMGAENLKGTIFEREMTKALGPLSDDPYPIIKPKSKTYRVLVFWKEALMINKVNVVDQGVIEPAQFDPSSARVMWRVLPEPAQNNLRRPILVRKPPPEPAHMVKDILSEFGGQIAPWKEQVLVSAIDEVYPELNFAQRLANSKANVALADESELRNVRQEPVQMAPEQGGQSELTRAVLTDMAAVLRKHGY